MQLPFCSIIVLNYQGERIIRATLESLSKLSYPKDRFEVIVVDNNSMDKSREVIENYIDSRLRGNDTLVPTANDPSTSLRVNYPLTTLYLDKNLGFAGGNNEGIRIAKGTYVVLLNNDCIVDPSWLTELVKVAEKDEKIFAVGSKVYLQQTNKIQNAGIIMFEDGYGRDVGAVVKNHTQNYAEDIGQYNREKETYAACAVAALYRKSILDRIGLLDDAFFMYYEDVELSERARMRGFKIMYAPHAIVHHDHAASSGEWSNFFIYQSELGRLLHVFFWFPQRIFWREYLKFFGKSLLRIPLGIRRNKLNQQSQYIKISLFIVFHLVELCKKRNKKHEGIPKGVIEKNYQSIKDNKR